MNIKNKKYQISNKFLRINIIVLFSGGEWLGKIEAEMPIAIGVSLEKDCTIFVSRSISGDGKGCREVRKVKASFNVLTMMLIGFWKIPLHLWRLAVLPNISFTLHFAPRFPLVTITINSEYHSCLHPTIANNLAESNPGSFWFLWDVSTLIHPGNFCNSGRHG